MSKQRLSKKRRQQIRDEAAAITIAGHTKTGMQAWMLASTYILEQEFGFTKDERERFIALTMYQAGKFLKMVNTGDGSQLTENELGFIKKVNDGI